MNDTYDRLNSRIGSPCIRKGHGIEAWDMAPTCNDTCPLFGEECPEDSLDKPCPVHRMYMSYVQDKLGRSYLKKLTDKQKLQVALMLFPLFHQLLSFKLYELTLPIGGVLDEKGKVNGVYKEIRSTIKDINDLLENIKPSLKIKKPEDMFPEGGTHAEIISGRRKNI